MYIAPHHTLEELEQMVVHSHFSARRQRLQIIILAMKAKSHEKIALELNCATNTCVFWIKRYNKFNLEGLENRKPRGKDKMLTPEEENRLRERLKKGPTPQDGCCVLRGPQIQRILKEEFGKVRSLSTVYDLLHALNYTLQTPRPKHYKSQPKQQEEFKKKSRRR
jgi:transposase